jgi:glycopeptide antibiotics resistance protein
MNDMTASAKPDPSSSDSARWLLLAYLGVLAFLVFFPFGRGLDLGDGLNTDAFKTIQRALELGPRSVSFRLMIGNVLAFVPLGILLPMAIRTRWSLLLVALVAVATSVAIEAGQYAISMWVGYSYRSTDIDDVILNVLGAMIGGAIFVAWQAMGRLSSSRS